MGIVPAVPPAGPPLNKQLTRGVRAASAPQTTSTLTTLQPGESLTLDGTKFAGMVPHTGTLTLAIGAVAGGMPLYPGFAAGG